MQQNTYFSDREIASSKNPLVEITSCPSKAILLGKGSHLNVDFPLSMLDASLSVIEAIKRADSSMQRDYSVIVQERLLDFVSMKYRRAAVFIFTSLVKVDSPITSTSKEVKRYIVGIHSEAKLLAIGGPIKIGGCWPSSGFLAVALAGQSVDQKDRDVLVQESLKFVSTILDNFDGPPAGYSLECSIGIGYTNFDRDVIDENKEENFHKLAAKLSSYAANYAGHISKRKRAFKVLLNSDAYAPQNGGIAEKAIVYCANDIVSEQLRQDFLSPLKIDLEDQSIKNCVYEYSWKGSSEKFNYNPDALVIAIDIDIANSSTATLNLPSNLSLYRSLLQERLRWLEFPGVYSGVFAGDGQKFLCFPYGEDDSEIMNFVRKVYRMLNRIIAKQSAIQVWKSGYFLRIGMAIGKQDSSFADVHLGKAWDNPNVDYSSSAVMERAEYYQEEVARAVSDSRQAYVELDNDVDSDENILVLDSNFNAYGINSSRNLKAVADIPGLNLPRFKYNDFLLAVSPVRT